MLNGYIHIEKKGPFILFYDLNSFFISLFNNVLHKNIEIYILWFFL